MTSIELVGYQKQPQDEEPSLELPWTKMRVLSGGDVEKLARRLGPSAVKMVFPLLFVLGVVVFYVPFHTREDAVLRLHENNNDKHIPLSGSETPPQPLQPPLASDTRSDNTKTNGNGAGPWTIMTTEDLGSSNTKTNATNPYSGICLDVLGFDSIAACRAATTIDNLFFTETRHYDGYEDEVDSFEETDFRYIVAAVPTELGLLTQLTDLVLPIGVPGSTIPSEIGLLTRLTSLSVFGAGHNGTLPPEMGFLKELTCLYLNDGPASPVPSFLWQLDKLQTLSLSFSAFTGSLPTQIGLLTNLFKLDVSLTSLTGTIPTELAQLTALTSLVMDHTGIQGVVPSSLCPLYLTLSMGIECDCCEKQEWNSRD